MLKSVPLGLVILVLALKVKAPPEPLMMSTPASPPFRVVVPLKLYVPSALSNCKPVPLVAFSVPVWKVNVPVPWAPETLRSAALLACVMLPL